MFEMRSKTGRLQHTRVLVVCTIIHFRIVVNFVLGIDLRL